LDAKLEEAGNRLVVIDFYATWCGPCKIIGPVMDVLAKELKDEVVILKVDVDEADDIAAEYEIAAMPTFAFIKNKQVIEKFSGANEKKIRDTIAANK
jgi:thioredoxin 1